MRTLLALLLVSGTASIFKIGTQTREGSTPLDVQDPFPIIDYIENNSERCCI